MEENEERKDRKKQFVDDKGQRFYFNEEGKLIVESNKGVWEDGIPHVKMYGNFQCNAKTLGIIINKFKGCPVVVKGVATRVVCTHIQAPFIEETAIVNPTEEDKGIIDKIECYEARNENMNEQVKQLKEELNMHKEMSYKLQENVHEFNKLPWWKRMLKKIEVK